MKTAREYFNDNVKGESLLREFISNYRLPRTDRDGVELQVGDDVVCECTPAWERSWINGKCGIVMKLGVTSCAGECEGHLLQVEGSITVAPIECVKRVSK